MFVTQEQIFASTNGGLDVILHYYPQAAESSQNQSRKFKIRATDKTASASLKRLKDGIWVVTDFGGDQKPRNAVLVAMQEENCEWKAAIEIIATRFNLVAEEQKRSVIKSDFETRPATEEEKDGEYKFDIKDVFSENDITELFSRNVIEFYKKAHGEQWKEKLQEVCRKENFYSLRSFTQVKDRKAIVTSSNDLYPIYLIEGEGFKKIYQPKNYDKQYRFRYTGERPKDYIFGYKRLQKQWNDLVESKKEEELGQDDDKKKKEIMLEHVMICSGDRDSLNASALGYNVIWLNSETAKLKSKTMTQLRKMCEEIYNVPDIDATGRREGHELALEYLDIKTVWFPDSLRDQRDFRGAQCKDLRDYLHYHTKWEFDQLVRVSLPYQFWDMEPQFKRNGDFHKWGYKLNNTQLYNFLMKCGFWRFKIDNEKEGYIYVQVLNNTVKQIRGNDVKAFINQFIEDRRLEVELRNTFYRSNQMGEASLSNLKDVSIDFTDYDKLSQYMFFINKTWKITAAGIEEFKPGEISKYVWDAELIKHRVNKLKYGTKEDPIEKPFEITPIANVDGTIDYDIKINDTGCMFLKYLVNASRIHWRKEYEQVWTPDQEEDRLKYIEENKFNIAGPKLTPEEIREQKIHLVNKIYSIGYLLHRYKDASRPWCVFAMDAKPAEDGESHGGSGKSIAYKSLRFFMNNVTLDGRNSMLTKNPHIYELVTEHTDYILIDDANQYLDFSFFFAPLTGDLAVNPKNNKQYIIPFQNVPKFAITSNYTLRQTDPSTVRRILYTVFSDYYHYNATGEYRESRGPKDDMGKNLFQDFTPEEWNAFINTCAWCCSAYLNFEKIDPPMENVNNRNLQTIMGPDFEQWADVYFSPESGRLNELVPKKEAMDDFTSTSNRKLYTSQRFGKALEAWCKYNRYELNPIDLQNSQGRIIRRTITYTRNKEGAVTGEKNTTGEMIFILTNSDGIKAHHRDPSRSATPTLTNTGSTNSSNADDDLPF